MSLPLDPMQPPGQVSSMSYGPQTRPMGITAFAILNVLFGIIGLFGVLTTVVFTLFSRRLALGRNPVVEMMQQSTLYAAYVYTLIILGTIFSVLLIIAGFSLPKMSQRARTFSLVYGVYLIIGTIVERAVTFFAFSLPKIEQAQSDLQLKGAIFGLVVGVIVGIITGLLSLIYPIAIWIYFLRPSVKEAFQNWQAD